jgi:hypothetical protein
VPFRIALLDGWLRKMMNDQNIHSRNHVNAVHYKKTRHMTSKLFTLIALPIQHIINIGKTGQNEREMKISHLNILEYGLDDLNNLHIVNHFLC